MNKNIMSINELRDFIKTNNLVKINKGTYANGDDLYIMTRSKALEDIEFKIEVEEELDEDFEVLRNLKRIRKQIKKLNSKNLILVNSEEYDQGYTIVF